MKINKKIFYVLGVILALSMAIFVIDYIFKENIPEIVHEINSGVIGAILTTIITFMLLAQQSESTENQTKHSVIYEEKVRSYNTFLKQIVDSLEDGVLTYAEMRKILYLFANIRMHLPNHLANSIEKSLCSIDEDAFIVDQNGVNITTDLIKIYNEICNYLKADLYPSVAKETTRGNSDFSNFSKLAVPPLKKIVIIDNIEQLCSFLTNNSNILIVREDKPPINFTLREAELILTQNSHKDLNILFNKHNLEVETRIVMTTLTYGQITYSGRFTIEFYHSGKKIAHLYFNNRKTLTFTAFHSSVDKLEKGKNKSLSITDNNADFENSTAFKYLKAEVFKLSK